MQNIMQEYQQIPKQKICNKSDNGLGKKVGEK